MDVKKIAIVGAGGFGREISLLINLLNEKLKIYDKIGYYDDGIMKGTIVEDLQVLGKVEDLNDVNFPLDVVVAIGDPIIQQNINQRLNNLFLRFPNVIHPGVTLKNARNKFGYGNIITEGFVMTCDIEIGNFNVFNTRVSIGHDVKIGNFNVFNPNTQISGEVAIRNSNFFGVNSCVLQKISIGSNNRLGAYSLLTRNIKSDNKYFGIPAKRIKE